MCVRVCGGKEEEGGGGDGEREKGKKGKGKKRSATGLEKGKEEVVPRCSIKECIACPPLPSLFSKATIATSPFPSSFLLRMISLHYGWMVTTYPSRGPDTTFTPKYLFYQSMQRKVHDNDAKTWGEDGYNSMSLGGVQVPVCLWEDGNGKHGTSAFDLHGQTCQVPRFLHNLGLDLLWCCCGCLQKRLSLGSVPLPEPMFVSGSSRRPKSC